MANKLMDEYGQEFTTDFQGNKEKVQLYCDVKSKPMRNKIAGYITRTVGHREKTQSM
ncbi:MAG: hypothetical protein KAU03_00915 [Candidatus Altiarchaeales archaeon]|nr:hypothetical protein [Candidatus Altiarchaeales archaeon]